MNACIDVFQNLVDWVTSEVADDSVTNPSKVSSRTSLPLNTALPSACGNLQIKGSCNDAFLTWQIGLPAGFLYAQYTSNE